MNEVIEFNFEKLFFNIGFNIFWMMLRDSKLRLINFLYKWFRRKMLVFNLNLGRSVGYLESKLINFGEKWGMGNKNEGFSFKERIYLDIMIDKV